MKNILLQRGDLVVCAVSGDYGKPRPAVVVQSDLFNETHQSVTLCPITTHLVDASLFRLSLLPNPQNGLIENSQIMVDKISSVHRDKIRQKIGSLSAGSIRKLNEALSLWLAL